MRHVKIFDKDLLPDELDNLLAFEKWLMFLSPSRHVMLHHKHSKNTGGFESQCEPYSFREGTKLRSFIAKYFNDYEIRAYLNHVQTNEKYSAVPCEGKYRRHKGIKIWHPHTNAVNQRFVLDIDNKTGYRAFEPKRDGLYTLSDAVALCERKGIAPFVIAQGHPGGFTFVFESIVLTLEERFQFLCWFLGVDYTSKHMTTELLEHRVDIGWFKTEAYRHVIRVPGTMNLKSGTMVQAIVPRKPTVVTRQWFEDFVVNFKTVAPLSINFFKTLVDAHGQQVLQRKAETICYPVELPVEDCKPPQAEYPNFFKNLYLPFLEDIPRKHREVIATAIATHYTWLRTGGYRWCCEDLAQRTKLTKRQAATHIKRLCQVGVLQIVKPEVWTKNPYANLCRTYVFGPRILDKLFNSTKYPPAPAYEAGLVNQYIMQDVRFCHSQGASFEDTIKYLEIKTQQQISGKKRGSRELGKILAAWDRRVKRDSKNKALAL